MLLENKSFYRIRFNLFIRYYCDIKTVRLLLHTHIPTYSNANYAKTIALPAQYVSHCFVISRQTNLFLSEYLGALESFDKLCESVGACYKCTLIDGMVGAVGRADWLVFLLFFWATGKSSITPPAQCGEVGCVRLLLTKTRPVSSVTCLA